jgi:hypothetical protein
VQYSAASCRQEDALTLLLHTAEQELSSQEGSEALVYEKRLDYGNFLALNASTLDGNSKAILTLLKFCSELCGFWYETLLSENHETLTIYMREAVQAHILTVDEGAKILLAAQGGRN